MKSKILVLMIALLLLLSGMIVAVEGEALDIDFSEENETIEIHDWYDLDAVRDDLEADYVLMNDLDENTDGYDELASEEANEEDKFEETLGEPFEEYESGTRFELSYSPVDELLSVEDNEDEIEAEIVDPEEGIIEIQEDVEGRLFVEYTTTEEIALGWEPIGDEFSGDFDGNGYEIKYLYIDRRIETNVGLFEELWHGEIKDLSMVDINVSGKMGVGGVVGFNRGNLYNLSVTGKINGESAIGGLIGSNGGQDTLGHIYDSFSKAKVSGAESIGGVAGANLMGGFVTNSFANGNVNGEERVGIIVGSNDGVVENSYATGNVTGDMQIGGLVGNNNVGTVSKSYSIGEVSGNSSVGGLVGNNTGTVENSFWDIETSGIEESDGGTGKTTEEMKDIETFTNTTTEGLDEPWDFLGDPNDDEGDEDVWNIDGRQQVNDGYPFLDWSTIELTINIDGEGTVEVDGEEFSNGQNIIFVKGEEVTITAEPDEGLEFVGWIDTDETGDEITIVMDEDKEITAVFEEEEEEETPGFLLSVLLTSVIISIVIDKSKKNKES